MCNVNHKKADRVSRASNYMSGIVADSYFPTSTLGKDFVSGAAPPLNGVHLHT